MVRLGLWGWERKIIEVNCHFITPYQGCMIWKCFGTVNTELNHLDEVVISVRILHCKVTLCFTMSTSYKIGKQGHETDLLRFFKSYLYYRKYYKCSSFPPTDSLHLKPALTPRPSWTTVCVHGLCLYTYKFFG